MRFELTRVVRGCRLGRVSGVGPTGPHSLEVPGCLLYTRCGTVPHLTPENLQTLKDLPALTQVTLDSLAEHHEVLDECKGGVRKFAGLQETLIFCSLRDPATTCPTGHVTSKTVSVWGNGGRIELSVAKFMALQTSICPDVYESMADGETPRAGASRKATQKAVDRTLAHLDACLTLHDKSQELENSAILGVIKGGDVLEERRRSARETAARRVTGFVLDGFQSHAMEQKLRDELIKAVTTELPEEKPRLLRAVGRPDEVLLCVEAGVDLFEGFFPYQVTERGCALDFSFTLEPAGAAAREPTASGENPSVEEHRENRDERPENMTDFEMNLRDRGYRDDLRPVVEGCDCYCCKNHTRSYLHHLLVTNELLAGVLLMLHNTRHYLGFFRALRYALANDRLQDLKDKVIRRHRHLHATRVLNDVPDVTIQEESTPNDSLG